MRFGKLLAPQEPCDWSPDGKFIIYGDGQTDTGDDLGFFPCLLNVSRRCIGEYPQWRRDGKELFYLSSDKKLMAVPVTTASGFEAGNPAALFSSGTEISGYDVSTDGQRFFVIETAAEPTLSPINIVVNWTVGLKSL